MDTGPDKQVVNAIQHNACPGHADLQLLGVGWAAAAGGGAHELAVS